MPALVADALLRVGTRNAVHCLNFLTQLCVLDNGLVLL